VVPPKLVHEKSLHSLESLTRMNGTYYWLFHTYNYKGEFKRGKDNFHQPLSLYSYRAFYYSFIFVFT